MGCYIKDQMLTVCISYSFRGVMCHHLHFRHEKSVKGSKNGLLALKKFLWRQERG